jgi:hypothetical protein
MGDRSAVKRSGVGSNPTAEFSSTMTLRTGQGGNAAAITSEIV